MNSDRKEMQKVGTTHWWNNYFLPGGGWVENNGRLQTKIFAEKFIKYSKIDANKKVSLLDVGCALGDALQLFRVMYPQAKLSGIDISATAISRCKAELSHIASLGLMEIDEISESFDIIYISNVLEHLVDYKEKSKHLIKHCKQLFILVPFNEMRKGKVLEPDPGEHHQHSFNRHSFDFLLGEKLASSIRTKIFSCPIVFSWPWRTWMMEYIIKNPFRILLGKSLARNPRIILYDICSLIKG